MKVELANKYNPGDDGFLLYLTKEELMYAAAAIGWTYKENYSMPISNFWAHAVNALKVSFVGSSPVMTKVLPNPYTNEFYKQGDSFFPKFNKDWKPNLELIHGDS